MKIVIFDSDNVIGQHLVKLFNKEPHHIFPLSEKNDFNPMRLTSLKEVLSRFKPDVIYNCAAHVGGIHYVSKFAADIIHDNVQMVLNTYRAIKEVCPKARIINPLSNCSYPGDADIHIEDKLWDGPVHQSVFSYGNAKRFIAVVAHCYKKQYDIQSINFLIPNHFGPLDSNDPVKTHALGGIIIRMIKAHQKNEPVFEIWGSGKPIREWGFVPDIAEILKLALSLNADLTTPVNIAQNKGYSIKQSAKMIARAIGFKGKLIFNTNYPDGAVKKVLDDKKFRTIFPDFKFTNHRKAIRQTVNYYLSVL